MKNGNFSTFRTSCFYSLKRGFFVLDIAKHIFLAYITFKKNMENWPIFDQNHGPLWKNDNFSIFCTSCFYSLETRFFLLEYRKTHFPGPYCQKKRMENGKFFTKRLDKPLWKNDNFSTFWSSWFYSLERRFYVLKYRKTHFPGLYYL